MHFLPRAKLLLQKMVLDRNAVGLKSKEVATEVKWTRHTVIDMGSATCLQQWLAWDYTLQSSYQLISPTHGEQVKARN